MAIIKDTVTNDDGQEVSVYIEVDAEEAVYDIYAEIDPDDKLRSIGTNAKEAFKKAMELVHTCAEQVTHTIQKIPAQARPSACEVQLSIKISTGIAILAKASSEAQLQVTLKWGEQVQP